MGAASSFITLSDKSARSNKSSTGVISDKTGSDRSQGSNPNTARYTAVALPSSVISISLLDTCILSWEVIEPPSKKLDRESKVISFCQSFFQILDTLDLDQEVRDKFRPRRQSAILTRSGLLIRIVKYMLSVPNDSFKVKAKIRALGRSHSTRGIIEKHFLVFSDVLLLSLAESLHVSSDDPVILSWKLLLQFFIEQLTFDKVIYVSHHTTAQHIHDNNHDTGYEEVASALLRESSLNDPTRNGNGNNGTTIFATLDHNSQLSVTTSTNNNFNNNSNINSNKIMIISEENMNSLSMRSMSMGNKLVPRIDLLSTQQDSYSSPKSTHGTSAGTITENGTMTGTFVNLDKASLDRNVKGIAMIAGADNRNQQRPISEDIASTTTESIASSRDRDFPPSFGTLGTLGSTTQYNGTKPPTREITTNNNNKSNLGSNTTITTPVAILSSSKSSSNSDFDVSSLEAELLAVSLAAASDFAETSQHVEEDGQGQGPGLLNLNLTPELSNGVGLISLGPSIANITSSTSSTSTSTSNIHVVRTSSIGSSSRRMEAVHEVEFEGSSDGSEKSKSKLGVDLNNNSKIKSGGIVVASTGAD